MTDLCFNQIIVQAAALLSSNISFDETPLYIEAEGIEHKCALWQKVLESGKLDDIQSAQISVLLFNIKRRKIRQIFQCFQSVLNTGEYDFIQSLAQTTATNKDQEKLINALAYIAAQGAVPSRKDAKYVNDMLKMTKLYSQYANYNCLRILSGAPLIVRAQSIHKHVT